MKVVKGKEADTENKNFIKLTKEARIFLYATGLILLAASIAALFIKLRPHTQTKEMSVNNYNITTQASYKVHLQKNDIFDGDFLEEGRVYPSAITDTVSIDFNSEIILTNAVNLSGDYTISAVLQGYQAGDGDEKSIIYEKVYPLADGKTDENVTDDVKIDKSLDIDRMTYKKYAQEIEGKLGGETDKDFYVLFSGKYSIDGEEKEFSYKVDIPISNDKFYQVKKDDVSADKGDITETTTVSSKAGFREYVVYILLLIVSAAILAFVRFFSAEAVGEELKLKKLMQFMRKYGSRMICIDTLPAFGERPLIKIKSIVDIVELSDEIKDPIFYVEGENNLPKDDKIYIFAKQYVYIFEMKVNK